jgi:hypothetical protein
MLQQLLALAGPGRRLVEIMVSEQRTWLAGDWRFYEFPDNPQLFLIEHICWTWRGDVHSFSIEGYAPACPRALAPDLYRALTEGNFSAPPPPDPLP